MRHGNFSSSSAAKLMTNNKAMEAFGVPGLTYIAEKKLEIRLGRNLNKDQHAKPVTWGRYVESRVFNLLPTDYVLCSEDRLFHPTIKHWVGIPDMTTDTKVCDIKCPYSIKEYCEKADVMITGNAELLKKEYPTEFWQLVSNAILSGKEVAELIVYCPYIKELIEIKESVAMFDGEEQRRIAWIHYADDAELPYLLPGQYYKNLYKMEFPVLQEYKDALTSRIEQAVKLLHAK